MSPSLPIKRNNPLNIKKRQKGYIGLESYDSNGFAVFKHWIFGLIAGLSVVNYYRMNGYSIEHMIDKYTGDENYISYVTYINSKTGYDIESTDWTLSSVAHAMMGFELGNQPFDKFAVNI